MNASGIEAGQAFVRLAINDSEFVAGVSRVCEQIKLIGRNVDTFRSMAAGISGATEGAGLFSKALSFIAANPATVALTALMLAFKGVQMWMNKCAEDAKNAAEHSQYMAKAAEQQTAKMRESIAADNEKIKRLETLASIENKTTQQMDESQSIIDSLNGTYGNLGITFDKLTGKIYGVSDAYRKMGEEQKKMLQGTLTRQIINGRNNAIDTADALIKDTNSMWTGRNNAEKAMLEKMGYSFKTVTGASGIAMKTNELEKRNTPLTIDQVQSALEYASNNRGDLKDYIPQLEKLLAQLEAVQRAEVELKGLQTKQTEFEKEAEKKQIAEQKEKEKEKQAESDEKKVAQSDEIKEIIIQTQRGMSLGGFSGAQTMQDVWGANALQEQAAKATISIKTDVHKIANNNGAVSYQ